MKKLNTVNGLLVEEIQKEYRAFPAEISKSLSLKTPLAFVHAYPNLDRVLNGLDLVARATLVQPILRGKQLIGGVFKLARTSLGVEENSHVFLGVHRTRGVATAYVHKIEGDLAYIGSMGREFLKG